MMKSSERRFWVGFTILLTFIFAADEWEKHRLRGLNVAYLAAAKYWRDIKAPAGVTNAAHLEIPLSLIDTNDGYRIVFNGKGYKPQQYCGEFWGWSDELMGGGRTYKTKAECEKRIEYWKRIQKGWDEAREAEKKFEPVDRNDLP